VKVKIEQEYTRATGGGIGYTKAAGNYGGAFYPTSQAIKEGYNQVIWTDHKEHKYIEESGTMNLMLLIGDTFVTPPLTDRILAGVTRRSIITLVKEQGWAIEERPVTVDEIVEAARTGALKEAFGMGTAAVVSQIDTIGHEDTNYSIPTPADGKAMEIKRLLNDIRLGRTPDTNQWMVDVVQPATAG
jgi:branched-chain amino acid aminotransferase